MTSLPLLLLLLDAPAPTDTAALARLVSIVAAGLLVVVLRQAWGPGNHLEFASRIHRAKRSMLPADVAKLLREERDAWYYGNLAADIINFKGFGGHYNHCHRWTIVDDMRSHATTPAEEAFCLGYLGHLAADTIAHNHFVPYHLARYARTKGLGHLYWEMRADRFVRETRWQLVSQLKRDRDLDRLDELVNATVPKKALSMRTNKLLFNHVLLVAERDRWRRGVDRLHDVSIAPLEESFLERFRRAAVARIRLALTPGGIEEIAHVDTNGKAAQAEAWARRKRVLRTIAGSKKRKRISEEQASVFLEGMETPPPRHEEALPHW